MAVPIQLALQGGGAKITYLIAAMSAVRELERKEKIRVTRIAGTSAGAIAGALYAAGVDLEAARAIFKSKRREFLKAFPPQVGRVRAAYKIARREPLWDVSPLRRFLLDLLGTKTIFEHLDIPLIVVASDLTNMRPCIYESPQDPIVTSLLDSAGIPFLFRTVPNGPGDSRVIVDGGICENLPSHYLQHSPERGEVLGITFKVWEEAETPPGIMGYAQALLETAMNASVRRAQLELGLNTFIINTRAGTFDFLRAFEVGLDTEFDATKVLAERFFEDYLVRHDREAQELLEKEKTELSSNVSASRLPPARLEEVFGALRSMYQLQQEPQRFEFLRLRQEVTARSQLQKGAGADEILHEVTFRATDRPVTCHKIKLTSAQAEIRNTQCDVFDVNGEPVPVDIVPISEDGAEVRDYLVFFRSPIQPGDPRAPIRLRVRDTATHAVKLRERGRDELLMRASRAAGPIGEVEVVAHLPLDLGNVLVAPWDAEHPLGARMTPAELTRYEPPPGFVTVGWKGTDVPPNTLFGCILVIP